MVIVKSTHHLKVDYMKDRVIHVFILDFLHLVATVAFSYLTCALLMDLDLIV